ncbi:MAG: 6-phosphogluconolactonase [Candidatus Hydrogenedentes bacterium]|nr:6-phosphogluconolactonase [Candidatus Hydrogenedentota bacterium]
MDMRLEVSPDPEHMLAQALVEFLRERDETHIAVSGGTSPVALFQLLTGKFRKEIRWSRIILFQVDERCVPPDDVQSNWRMITAELLSKANGITAHRIEAERPGAAEDYQSILIRNAPIGFHGIPQLDLILLGMGGDGHTASLFPDTKALEEQKRLVVLNEVPVLGANRVTMTFPLLNTASHRWFLVKGADKAKAFTKVCAGKLPAGQLVSARWFVDPEVAGAET